MTSTYKDWIGLSSPSRWWVPIRNEVTWLLLQYLIGPVWSGSERRDEMKLRSISLSVKRNNINTHPHWHWPFRLECTILMTWESNLEIRIWPSRVMRGCPGKPWLVLTVETFPFSIIRSVSSRNCDTIMTPLASMQIPDGPISLGNSKSPKETKRKKSIERWDISGSISVMILE